MTEDRIKEILEDCQHKVAVKYNLGTKLVTGHKIVYFNEAAINTIKVALDRKDKDIVGDAVKTIKIAYKQGFEDGKNK